jgi:hypothetical protein
MGGKRQYKARDYAVGEQLLALRMRAELRQAELAALLQVSQRSIHLGRKILRRRTWG